MTEQLAAALMCHKSGKLDEAEALYRGVLAENARNPEALRLLGVLAGQLGKPLQAMQLISMAIEANPREASYYNDLGNALKASGYLKEARASYRAAIAFDDGYADAHFNLGNLCRAEEDFAAAVANYQQAITLSPFEADAHNNLGTALLDLGKMDDAERAFRRAIALVPSYAEAHFNLGTALAAMGDHARAIECFDAALRHKSDLPKAYLNRGVSQGAAGDAAAGMASYARAIELSPLDAVAHNNLGMALLDAGRTDEAVQAFQRAILLNPSYADAHFNLGNALAGDPARTIECFNQSLKIRPNYAKAYQNRGISEEALGDLDSAAESYRAALKCAPDCRDVWSNLGQLLTFQGDEQGIRYLEQIVEEEPSSAKAHWNLGVALLLLGNYARGWKEYEWRWQREEWRPRPFSQPQWQGEALGGATILIHAEQGLGDTLQFARYLPLVTERGGRVVLEGQPALRRLLENHPGVAAFVDQGEALPEFSWHCPLMSLPLLFGTTLETIPAVVSYAVNEAELHEGMRVGLVWSGNPEHVRDGLRSVPLKEFRDLLEVDSVSFVSLQKGVAAEQMNDGTYPFCVPHRIESATDFADTRAIIQSLDLVITVDTAIAHLAGSMGKPVWVLLSNLPDWRWGLDSVTTPWYSTARLFRQKFPDGWSEVMKEIACDLTRLVAGRRGTCAAPATMLISNPTLVLKIARHHLQAGDLNAAEGLCRKILVSHPKHAETLHLLGLVAGKLGKPGVAVQLFGMAIEINPREARYYNDLGEALRACGHIAQAKASYESAIAFDNRSADAHFNMGNLFRMQEDFVSAAESYERAVALFPTDADAYSRLGTTLQDMRLTEKAVQAFLRAAELAPVYSEGFFNLGNAFAAKGEHPRAIEYFDEALKINSNHPRALVCRGISQAALGELEAAVESFERTLALAPTDAVAHNNLGATLLDMKQPSRALPVLTRATELDPAYAEAHFNLGNALAAEGDHRRAIASFDRTLQLRPKHRKAFQNRGTSQEALGNLDDSVASYRHALACEPGCRDVLSNLGQALALQGDAQGIAYLEQIVSEEPPSAEAHWNLGLARLLHGDYSRGWPEYEWRWQWQGSAPARPSAQPQWLGEELAGATVLLHAEQGVGDTLQFARYVPLVAQRVAKTGGRLVLEVQPSLHRLLSGLPGVDALVRQGEPLPDFSFHCPLMSLPLVFATTLETIPAVIPYARFKRCDRDAENVKVGLVWSGNPAHLRDRLRSIPLKELLPLVYRDSNQAEKVSFVSLQKGAAAGQNHWLPSPCADARDFSDTADVISSLDLVITVDTAVAHLAGSMGKPVWILLSNYPDWRWGLRAEATPWYPSARLFRQKSAGGWAEVVQRVATELERFVAAFHCCSAGLTAYPS